MRAIAMLPALTGNIRRPGSGFLYLNGGESRGIDFDWLGGAELARPGAPAAISQMDLAAVLADPARAARSCAGTSIPWRRAPSRPRCAPRSRATTCSTVVCDLFLTDTAGLRRLRPARGGLPRERRHRAVVLPPHALGPGEGRRAAGRTPCATPRSSAGSQPAWASTSRRCRRATSALIERLLAPSGVGWDELARAGTVRLFPEPRVQFADGFPTPERPHRDRVGRAPRPTGTPACPSRASTRRRRPASCGCSRRPRPGS